ncbi:MAG: hypothetical protein ACOC2N_02010 [Spirochaetota bacterium]
MTNTHLMTSIELPYTKGARGARHSGGPEQRARFALRALEADLHPPVTFRGVAGLRLFRDEIFGGLSFVFQADDAYYRKHGIYDFRRRRRGRRRAKTAIMKALTRIPPMRNEIRNRLQAKMVKPCQRVVEAWVLLLRAGRPVSATIRRGVIGVPVAPGHADENDAREKKQDASREAQPIAGSYVRCRVEQCAQREENPPHELDPSSLRAHTVHLPLHVLPSPLTVHNAVSTRPSCG